MPIDHHGDKWACEPCIRGHRSTKCAHQERYMLRVKKPGRPLTSCPHPPGSCTCEAEKVLMVVFKKDGQCICYPKNGGGNPSNQIPVPSNLASFSAVQAGQMQKPLKPALANSMQNLGQGRVHKAARSMTNIDAQRIGKTLESEANHKKFSRQGSMVNESNSTTNGTLISTFPAQLDVVSPQQNQLSNGYGHMSLNGYPHANGQLYNANTAVLSNHVDPAHSGLPIPLQSFASPYSNGTGPSTQFSPENTYTQSPSVYSGSISPVNYVGPAPAGSNPVADKNEWPALPNRNNEIYIASPYGKGSERPRLQPSSQEQINAGYMAADSQHCYCGAGCSCLLCPDHPHNTTTLMHLKEVTQILNHDLNNHSQSSSTHNSPTDEGAFAQANGNGFSPNPNHNRPSPIGQVVPKTEANIASPVDEVTEDYTGDDYLIVPYPMEQLAFYSDPCGCTDITGTCRCIEGCNCIGCICHIGHEEPSVAVSGSSTMPTGAEANPPQVAQRGSCCSGK